MSDVALGRDERAAQQLDDCFAEIEDCLVNIQGALRHRQQPQDFHFHKALHAARDGRDTLRKLCTDTRTEATPNPATPRPYGRERE